jgi:hypothetical protein
MRGGRHRCNEKLLLLKWCLRDRKDASDNRRVDGSDGGNNSVEQGVLLSPADGRVQTLDDRSFTDERSWEVMLRKEDIYRRDVAFHDGLLEEC